MHAMRRRRVMALPIGAALITLGLKFWAFLVTGSVAILSDAAESLINLLAAIMALVALEVAARPADATHPYGHEKAEYFSSGVEGVLILAAAVGISIEAWQRIWDPAVLGSLPLGLGIAVSAALANFGVARVLLRVARDHESITLEAHAKHLLTDVWTTAGVVVGLIAVGWTGWAWLDPAIALLVALNIVVSGTHLVRRSAHGLMDYTLPDDEVQRIETILKAYAERGATYHRLRTRHSGAQRFIDFHLLVPGGRSVQETHDLCEEIEADIRQQLGEASITIHIEPWEDPVAWQDGTEVYASDDEPVD